MSVGQDEAGFTLIELLVAMTLSLVVLAATLDAFAGFSRNSQAVNVKNDAQQDVRASTDQLARELRNAVSSGAPTPAPLETATPYDLIFQTVARTGAGSANADNVTRVRYCLDNSVPSREKLFKQTQRWTAATAPATPSTASCPDPDWSSWDSWKPPEVVADRLVNRDQGQDRPAFIFGYAPIGSTNLTDISGIQTSLFVNREPTRTRSTAELTSAVRLRNTNRAPTAAFTVVQQNTHVLLNASISLDPEGESLKYQWSLDGTPITGATSARLDYQGLVSGSTHTFTLQVTDSGNLSSQVTKTVVVK